MGVQHDFDLLSSFAVPAYLVSALGLGGDPWLRTDAIFVTFSIAATALLLMVAPAILISS